MNEIITLNINLLYYNKKYPLRVGLKNNYKEFSREAILNYQLLKGQVAKTNISSKMLDEAWKQVEYNNDKLSSQKLTSTQLEEIELVPWCKRYLKHEYQDCSGAITAKNKYITEQRDATNAADAHAAADAAVDDADDAVAAAATAAANATGAGATNAANTAAANAHTRAAAAATAAASAAAASAAAQANVLTAKNTLDTFINPTEKTKLEDELNNLIKTEKKFKKIEKKSIPSLIDISGAVSTSKMSDFTPLYLLKKQLINSDNIKQFQDIITKYITNEKMLEKTTKQLDDLTNKMDEEMDEKKKAYIAKYTTSKSWAVWVELKDHKGLAKAEEARIKTNLDRKYKRDIQKMDDEIHKIRSEIEAIETKYPILDSFGWDKLEDIPTNPIEIFRNQDIANIFNTFLLEKKNEQSPTIDSTKEHEIILKNIEFLVDTYFFKQPTIKIGSNNRVKVDSKELLKNTLKHLGNVYTIAIKIISSKIFEEYFLKYSLNLEGDVKYDDYPYQIINSIPNAKSEKQKIYLPNKAHNFSGTDLSFIKIYPKDIEALDKKNLDIKDNKEIFFNPDLLKELIKQVKNTPLINKRDRFEDPNALEHNIELITKIIFDPFQLNKSFKPNFLRSDSERNKFYYSTNNSIDSLEKNPYYITNYKISYGTKAGRQQIYRDITKNSPNSTIYNVNVNLTIYRANKKLTLGRQVTATCPQKIKDLDEAYGKINPKDPHYFTRNFGQRKKGPSLFTGHGGYKKNKKTKKHRKKKKKTIRKNSKNSKNKITRRKKHIKKKTRRY